MVRERAGGRAPRATQDRPQIEQGSASTPLDRPKSTTERHKSTPERPQSTLRRPKSSEVVRKGAQGAPTERPKSPKKVPRVAQGHHKAPKSHQNRPQNAPRTVSGADFATGVVVEVIWVDYLTNFLPKTIRESKGKFARDARRDRSRATRRTRV